MGGHACAHTVVQPVGREGATSIANACLVVGCGKRGRRSVMGARTDLPHAGAVDLAHWEAIEALASLDDGADLVAGGHVLVDLRSGASGASSLLP